MTSLMKTKAASDKIGVHPTTIQRWVKFFNLDCQKNEHGHYLFTPKDISFFLEIKAQLNNGLTLDEIVIPDEHEVELSDKLTLQSIMEQLELLKISVDQKADDVVSFQLLQQRRELEELTSTVQSLAARIMDLEEKLATKKTNTEYPPPVESLAAPAKQNWLKRVFSF